MAVWYRLSQSSSLFQLQVVDVLQRLVPEESPLVIESADFQVKSMIRIWLIQLNQTLRRHAFKITFNDEKT